MKGTSATKTIHASPFPFRASRCIGVEVGAGGFEQSRVLPEL